MRTEFFCFLTFPARGPVGGLEEAVEETAGQLIRARKIKEIEIPLLAEGLRAFSARAAIPASIDVAGGTLNSGNSCINLSTASWTAGANSWYKGWTAKVE